MKIKNNSVGTILPYNLLSYPKEVLFDRKLRTKTVE